MHEVWETFLTQTLTPSTMMLYPYASEIGLL